MTKPKTIEEALQLIPTHIMLRPGVEFSEHNTDESLSNHNGWAVCRWPHKVIPGEIARRPIPENVRQAMAVHLLQMQQDKDDKIIRSHPFESWLIDGEQPRCTRCGHYVCKCDEAYS